MTNRKDKEKVIEMSSEELQDKIVIPACARAHMISGLIFLHLAKIKIGKESEEANEKINEVFRAWTSASEDIYGQELAQKSLAESFKFFRDRLFKKGKGKKTWLTSLNDLELKKEDKK